MNNTSQLIKLVSKHFDISENTTADQLHEVLVKTFEYLIEDDFQKLLQILYRADVDQYKLKELLENTVGKSSAEIIADAYLDRQQQKAEMWNKYNRNSSQA
jgi:hypothetical protein